ncbi:hypothetical protein ABK046_49665, partial [Streptomyces caeruleatus]
MIRIEQATTNSEASIGFRDSSDTDATSWVIGKSLTLATIDHLGFFCGSMKMVLTTGGGLGIGTDSPQAPLDVNG